MKILGHYFCPKCDDITFGEHCPLEARVGVLPNFNVPDGWFDQLRAATK